MPEGANQPPPYEDRNLYLSDRPLQEAAAREGAGWAHDELSRWGERMGSAAMLALAARANRFAPELRTHDRFGERIDEVAFDPAWHELMAAAMHAGEHCRPWVEPRPGAQVARAAAYLLHAEVENGTQCPLTMTYAAVPVLRRHAEAMPALGELWLPRVLGREYDSRPLPIAAKRSALIGMGMTERQGGSDVRANITRAEKTADGSYRLSGHKWFFSAPMCDAHLVLAQAGGGPTCFLLPRMLPDRTRNAVRLVRLKDKLGNRSNASSEVEFERAQAWLLGEEGRGVPVIIEMVQHTRLDCAIGSAGIVRGATARALHHAAYRRAFGKLLVDQPLMRNVLADLVLEAEASTALALRLARAFEADAPESEKALARLATPAIKFWVCKRAPTVLAEAMEVLGGNGYVEDSDLPRFYREAPLNSIWEGSGNVMCLDVLRAASREPQAVESFLAELDLARGGDARLDRHAVKLAAALRERSLDERDGRRIAGSIAVALAAAILLRHAPRAIADAYCASRLGDADASGLGTLPAEADLAAIIETRLDRSLAS
ncbi:MAG TPA: isovaleryl-CoA dehydrogenase [Casimicrobiaceae bacterium]|nr:isovaleryl-CoA dehydrogenase [Casimicrobiaceae bacterium]